MATLAQENGALRDQLANVQSELAQSQKSTGAQSVSLSAKHDRDFMHGAAWFGRNAVHITDRMSANIAQTCAQLRFIAEAQSPGATSLEQVKFIATQCRLRMRKLFEGTLEANQDVNAESVAKLSSSMPLSASSL